MTAGGLVCRFCESLELTVVSAGPSGWVVECRDCGASWVASDDEVTE